MTHERDVIVTIDSLMEMFRDYAGEESIPWDAKPIRLMVNPQEKYKLAIEAESEEWKQGEGPIVVGFNMRRYYGV